ncbi:rhodanese-like domain-containing protein [Hymenobacter negativus]|uniref:Rhodanese-like domain-containing protein n=1 Tax=Hymenobacter negativus TaxID=2795026 RepID=A0ABS3QNK7_9BACT|nr:rhodanese-like domain-containing protein [Hymenobacter negativus]MBO2012821.1 rhodanese-like domain-containing protein [Hymenobacter negativus]
MGLKSAVIVSASSIMLLLSACGPEATDKTARPDMLYKQLLRTLYRRTVPTVAPAALVQELAQPTAPLLLDVRTPAEFRVSHLQGAQFVNYDSLAREQFADVPRTRPVVVYCSVGVRSERLGEHLQTLGFREVRNLYGGLFEWVNEGYPVYNTNGLTTNVHPYSAMWSPWLKRGRKVYE